MILIVKDNSDDSYTVKGNSDASYCCKRQQ